MLRFGTVIVALGMLAVVAPLLAQSPNGTVSVTTDFFPNRGNTGELRTRVFAEQVFDPTPRLLITASGLVEGLLARRPRQPDSTHTSVADAIARVVDASVDYQGPRFDLLVGFTRIAWGRLDELQPTDVVNPLDASQFFFESRSEARLPVALVRLRGHLTKNASIDGVYVPFFRRGRFDQLDEATSPFNLESAFAPDIGACPPDGCPTPLPFVVQRREPPRTFGSAQGGARLDATTGRVDWSVAAYRGLEPFGIARLGVLPSPTVPYVPIDVTHPRFTMVGADFETVRGEWGLRGELAAFIDDNFQAPSLQVITGHSVDAGLGVDRKAGDYRIGATAMFHREGYDQPIDGPRGSARGRSDLTLILSGDRSFARERYGLRTFGVYNARESSGFLRAIATAKVRDNVAVEGSGGWFIGDGRDLVGRFADSDFVYARLKYYF